jgi:hypothetical protein
MATATYSPAIPRLVPPDDEVHGMYNPTEPEILNC